MLLIAPLFIYLFILIFDLLLISANMTLDWNGMEYKKAFALLMSSIKEKQG